MKTVLRQLNIILKRDQKKSLGFLFFGALLVAAIDTLAVALMSPFMTLLTNISGFAESSFGRIMVSLFGERSTNQFLAILSVSIIVLYLFRGGCKILYNYWQAKIIANARTDLSTRLFSFVMHKPYVYHLRHNTAETQRLVSSDVGSTFTLMNYLLQSLSSGLVSIGIFFMLLALNWQLTFILILIVIFFFFFVKKFLKKRIRKIADMNFKANSEMNKWVSQAIGGLKTILVKRKQNYYVTYYQDASNAAAVANSNYVAVEGIPKVLIDTLCMVLVFTVVLVEVLVNNDIAAALPMFATFAIAAMRLIPVVGQVTSTVNAASFYRPSVDAICEVIQTGEVEQKVNRSIEKEEEESKDVQNHTELKEQIEVYHIDFHFDDADDYLFTNLSLTIPAKESVAFVGATGCGKTTLADIILGLQIPESGQILVDGIDIHKNPVWWANMIGYIPQFIYLCDDTIRSNVAFGAVQKETDDAWLWNCLERAQMKEFVQSLPAGLDTITGENGIRLSGGQRQRIGIARALYAKPQFLLMDEATSALDTETEKAIVDSINMLSGDMTLLVIAHRLSTIESCDIVYRIENGHVAIERGDVG